MKLSRRHVLQGAGVGVAALSGCSLQSGPSGGGSGATTVEGPVRGDADPVAVECEEGDSEPAATESSTVDDGADRRSTPDPWWAADECLSAGSQRVRTAVTSRLDADDSGISVWYLDGNDPVVAVHLETIRDRSETVVETPAVEFDALVAVTPRTVELTATVDDEQQTVASPVWVRSVVRYRE